MNTLIISYVLLYYIASITLGFSTSYLLSKSSYHFRYPLFFSTVQNFVHFVMAKIVLRMRKGLVEGAADGCCGCGGCKCGSEGWGGDTGSGTVGDGSENGEEGKKNVAAKQGLLFVSNGVLKQCGEIGDKDLIVFYEEHERIDGWGRRNRLRRDGSNGKGEDLSIGRDSTGNTTDNKTNNEHRAAHNHMLVPGTCRKHATVLNCINTLPCTLTGALDISLSTYSLTNVSFALYTIVKSSSPIFILLSSFVLNNEPVSFRTFFIIFLIGLGTFLITFSHDTLNLPQVLPILFASLISGIRWSLIQRYLSAHTNIFTFIATINLNISAILLILAIYMEGLPILNMHSFSLIVTLSVISFFLVWSEYTILKCFSCVFLCVLGIVKEMSIVVVSVYMGKVRLEGVNWIGLVLSVSGLLMYGVKK